MRLPESLQQRSFADWNYLACTLQTPLTAPAGCPLGNPARRRRAASPEPSVLLSYLQARSEPEASRHLEGLVRQAEPVIHGIIRRRWRVAPAGARGAHQPVEEALAEDMRGDAIANLVGRLQDFRGDPAAKPIESYRGLVAVTTYRVCDTYLRKKYPQRTSVQARLTALLRGRSARKEFALWSSETGERLCGLAAWEADRRPLSRGERYRRLLETPQAVAEGLLPREDVRRMNPGDLLAALFEYAGGPIELDDLVVIAARLWNREDGPAPPPLTGVMEETAAVDQRAPGKLDPTAREVAQRAYLQALWAEIRQLSARQATALLLNLKDGLGHGVIALLPIRGIATIREIAAAMDMTAERLAGLWNELPVDDLTIGKLLGCTRMQVIGLRKCARERLARRMRAFEEEG